jgi:hypothetical protein
VRRIKKVESQIESLKSEEDSGLLDFENAKIRREKELQLLTDNQEIEDDI